MNKILSILSTICGLIALGLYMVAGTNEFATSLSMEVIVPLAIGAVIGIFSIFKTFKLALLGQYLANLYGFISVFIVNITLITNLIYNVDGSTVPVALLAIVVFSGIATFGALISGIMTKYGFENCKKAKEA